MAILEKSFEDDLNEHYLNIKIKNVDDLDSIAIRVLELDKPEFILPLHVKRRDDTAILQYTLPTSSVALKYLGSEIKRESFVAMFLKIIAPFLEGGDWFLDPHNYLLDMENVYVDRRTGTVSFVYVPDISYRNSEEEIFDFLKAVFKQMEITDDHGLTLSLYRFFDEGEVRTLTGLRELFKQQEKPTDQEVFSSFNVLKEQKSVEQSKEKRAKADFSQEKGARIKDEESLKEEKKEKNEPEDVLSDIFGDIHVGKKNKKEKKPKKEKKQRGFFSSFRNQKREKASSSAESSLDDAPESDKIVADIPESPKEDHVVGLRGSYEPLSDSFESSDTVILEQSNPLEESALEYGYLQLMSSPIGGAPEYIPLQFKSDQLLVGREARGERRPDIAFPSQFKSIGRMHAIFERDKEGISLIDLGSLNHTTLNGETLIPNRPYMITSGSVVGFTIAAPVKYKIVLR